MQCFLTRHGLRRRGAGACFAEGDVSLLSPFRLGSLLKRLAAAAGATPCGEGEHDGVT